MRQNIIYILFCGALSFGLIVPSLYADEGTAEVEQVAQELTPLQLQQTAMPPMGEDRLGRILNRYYNEGLGGVRSWSKVVSLRTEGQIVLDGGSFEFNAYQKKPNLVKMTIRGNHRQMQMGFDGHMAWQVLDKSSVAEPMSDVQARRFMHGARFATYLVYPYEIGKRIEFIDTIPVDGAICHHLRVLLDTEYQVDYFIDIRTYLESKVVHTDLRSGAVSSVVYDEYIRELGMPIAKKVKSYEGDVWVSTLKLDVIQVNSGVMPWMFKMPE